MTTTKFGYFQVKTANGNGYVCVAMNRPAKENAGVEQHSAGFAFCSPKDHFNKKLARKIALGRLETLKNDFARGSVSPKCVQFALAESSIIQAMGEAMSTLVKNNEGPNWLKKAWLRQEVKFGLKQQHSAPRFGQR